MPSHVADAGTEENGAGEILLRPKGESATFRPANGDGSGSASRMLERVEALPSVLETVAERRARRRSHYVVYVTTFVMSIGFSIVLTGVWPYLQQLDAGVSKEFLGWAIAANPLGQMLASPILGLWGNKAGSNRGAFLLTVFMFIVGNALYAILSVFGYAARAVMVFSRFLVGVSSANIAIIRSYVASSTTTQERTTAVSLTSAAQGLGFIIGPAIQAAIAVGFSSESKELSNSTLPGANDDEFEDEGPDIEWNMYTAAGWFAVLLGIANIFLFLPCIFKEYPIAAKEAQLQRRAANVTDTRLPKPDYPVLVCVLISFFVILFIYVLLETLLVPMCIDLYAWTDEKAIMVAGIGLSIAGVISTIMFAMVGLLTRKCDERKVYMFLGLLPLLLSMICFFPMGSTYPKMQNCTSDVYPEHTNSTDIQTTTALSILSTNSSPFSSKDSDMVAPHNVTEGLITDVTAYPVTENPHIYENLLLGDGNLSDHNSVSRRRRHIARNEKCKDLGCPPEQEWCLYTPIIEQIQLGIAGFIAVVGYPVAFALSSSLFSKILGPKPQGVWMGVLTSTGSFSRVSGPIFVSYMYTSLGTRWTFGFLFFTLAFTVILMSVVYKRLVPMKITRA